MFLMLMLSSSPPSDGVPSPPLSLATNSFAQCQLGTLPPSAQAAGLSCSGVGARTGAVLGCGGTAWHRTTFLKIQPAMN